MTNVTQNLTKKITSQVSTPGLGVQLLTAGTAACIADLFTFPLDTTKVRLQVQGEGGACALQGKGVAGTLLHIARNEGPTALYSGIVPGLQRQMAFSAIRIGGYEVVRNKYLEMTGVTGGLEMMGVRIAAGVTTGTLAILVAQPTDVVKVRMQAAGLSQQYKVGGGWVGRQGHLAHHVHVPGGGGCLPDYTQGRRSQEWAVQRNLS